MQMRETMGILYVYCNILQNRIPTIIYSRKNVNEMVISMIPGILLNIDLMLLSRLKFEWNVHSVVNEIELMNKNCQSVWHTNSVLC